MTIMFSIHMTTMSSRGFDLSFGAHKIDIHTLGSHLVTSVDESKDTGRSMTGFIRLIIDNLQ